MSLFSDFLARRRARRQREREQELAFQQEEEARLQAEEEARLRAEEEMPSPFALLPFGSLLEQMMMGGGGWTRSLELDPRTGEWVDVSDAVPEPPPEPEPEAREAAREQPGPDRKSVVEGKSV